MRISLLMKKLADITFPNCQLYSLRPVHVEKSLQKQPFDRKENQREQRSQCIFPSKNQKLISPHKLIKTFSATLTGSQIKLIKRLTAAMAHAAIIPIDNICFFFSVEIDTLRVWEEDPYHFWTSI